jgi:hypothetical protein
VPFGHDHELRGHRDLRFLPDLNFNLPDGIEITVLADDRNGGIGSETFRLTLRPVNDPPGPFGLLNPIDGYTLEQFATTFSWRSASDPELDTVNYLLKIRLDSTRIDTTLIWNAGRDTSLVTETLEAQLVEMGIYRIVSAVWWVEATDGALIRSSNQLRSLTIPRVQDAPRDGIIPQVYVFDPPSPNPFNAAVRVSFALPLAGRTRLQVHDELGRRVATLLDWQLPAGFHRISWTPAGLPAGTYIIALQSGTYTASRPVVLVR